MELSQVYDALKKKVNEDPGKYKYTATISQKILNISEKSDQHAEAILGLILYHDMIKLIATIPSIDAETLEGRLIKKSTKKSLTYTIPYSGKTFEGGKGIKYPDLEDRSGFPSELKSIIVAYVEMIT